MNWYYHLFEWSNVNFCHVYYSTQGTLWNEEKASAFLKDRNKSKTGIDLFIERSK